MHLQNWLFVRWILDNLGVRRIEHGVRSIEDPELVRHLARQRITLDVCPISNVKLAVQGVPSMAAHPIRALFDAGVPVTINSDDTFFFGNRLEEEYFALHQELGFSKAELARIALADYDQTGVAHPLEDVLRDVRADLNARLTATG
jgi:adenosine deaminase